MYNFRALECLQCFTPEQIERFDVFLRSPYFYSGKLMHNFLQYLRPFLTKEEINETALSNKAIFAALQPNKVFKPAKVYTWKHELYELLQQFISSEASLQPTKSAQDLINVLHFSLEHQLEPVFEDALKKAEKYLSQQIHDRTYYYHLFLLEHAKNVWISRNNNPISLESQYICLERLHAVNKLQMIFVELNRCKALNLDFDFSKHQSFLDTLVASQFWDDEILRFHYYQLQLISKTDVDIYHLLRAELKKLSPKLHISEVRNTQILLSNFCIQQIRLNNTYFYAYYLDILLEKIDIEKAISIMDFKNMVTVALHAKDLDWTIDFLAQHQSIIFPAEFAQAAYQHNLARVYFLQQKYETALELLLSSKTDNIYYDIEAKILTIKILYEQINLQTLSNKQLVYKESELELKVDGFKSYLQISKKTNSVPPAALLAWKAFSRFSRRLIPIFLAQEYGKASKIKTDLVTTLAQDVRVVEHLWLIEKMDELIAKAKIKKR